MGQFFRFIRSIRVAGTLIAYLAVSGMVATLVPQGEAPASYYSRYPDVLAKIIIASGFSRFFSSLLFLVPVSMFFVNLAACTIHRFAKELRKKDGKRFGPVILHFGLMILVFGAALSFATRREDTVFLSEGERVGLPQGLSLSLLDFSFERYPDGRPKDWTSRVRVEKGEVGEVESFLLRVNRPLKIGSLTVYQSSYGSEQVIRMRDAAGAEHAMRRGEALDSGGRRAMFMAYDPESGEALLRISDEAATTIERLGPGGRAGGFEVLGIDMLETSGLQAVRDFGYPFVLAALLVTGLGIFLTFYRKIGEMKP